MIKYLTFLLFVFLSSFLPSFFFFTCMGHCVKSFGKNTTHRPYQLVEGLDTFSCMLTFRYEKKKYFLMNVK